MTDAERKKLEAELKANKAKERDIDKRIRENRDEADKINAEARANSAALDALYKESRDNRAEYDELRDKLDGE